MLVVFVLSDHGQEFSLFSKSAIRPSRRATAETARLERSRVAIGNKL